MPKGKNVTTIVGLRAYSAMSNILPEQTLGRGLRKMYPGNDVKKYVSVVGTDAFMDFVESIQSEVVELERAAMGAGTKPKSVFNRIVGDSLIWNWSLRPFWKPAMTLFPM